MRHAIDVLRQDLRLALRKLSSQPAFTAVAVLSLALGIGANTTIFTLVNAVLLRGLPVASPETLVTVYTTEQGQTGRKLPPVSRPNYQDLRDQAGVFDHLVNVFFFGADMVAQGGEAEQIGLQGVTSNYFTALGISAHRLFRAHVPVWQPGRSALSDRPAARQRHRCDPGLGSRPLPEGCPRSCALRRHGALRIRG